jgi:two-component system chemotaxis sensor kinase CheA
MLELFIFEATQNIEQLETTIVESESEYNIDQINEIFRIMHTIKGSSAMMMFDNIAGVAHAIEDLFFFLREENPKDVDFKRLSDYVLEGADFVKEELGKIQAGQPSDGDGSALIKFIEAFLRGMKGNAQPAAEAKAPAPQPAVQPVTPPLAAVTTSEEGDAMHRYKAKIHFQEGCEMENIRAYALVHNLQDLVERITHTPADVIDEDAIEVIRRNGFDIEFTSPYAHQKVHSHLSQTAYLRELDLVEIGIGTGAKPTEKSMAAASTLPMASDALPPLPMADDFEVFKAPATATEDNTDKKAAAASPTTNMINVSVRKLDDLLNIMSELVITEAMVTQNSELEGLQLDSFMKETRHLRKIISDLRATVMSMRLLPLSSTFFRMRRIVRDMCRQLNKDVNLEIVGEETEVDKTIIEHINDPIMHIIRNSIDHGVEFPEERLKKGKPEKARILLEAKNAGSDVLIIIKDDGRGINTEKVLRKAKENGLTTKPDAEYTDKEIHQFIFLPGFSTNDQVTAFSGRGVGMDVVTSNLEIVSGTAVVDSVMGVGTTFTLKIPLTLTIQDGMSVLVAGAMYTIPIANIIKSFKTEADDVFTDPSGNEMVTNRGEIFNVVRLYEFFHIEGAITDIETATLVMLEHGDEVICLMVDELIGQQQAVVKPMPKYFKKVRGISGCTLLGNGGISLIIDVAGFFDK